MEAPGLQDTGDGIEVVSIAGEVQAAPTWRDERGTSLGETQWKGVGRSSEAENKFGQSRTWDESLGHRDSCHLEFFV